MRKVAVLVLVVCFLAVGCSGMSYTAQRTVTGGAIGAASGAAIGAIAGNPGSGRGHRRWCWTIRRLCV